MTLKVIDGGAESTAPRTIWEVERESISDRTRLSFREQAEWLVQSEDYDERRRTVARIAMALEENYLEGMRAFAVARHVGSPVVLRELMSTVRATAQPLSIEVLG